MYTVVCRGARRERASAVAVVGRCGDSNLAPRIGIGW